MDVNLTISLMRGQMGAVIEKAVNVAVETVLGEMIRVVGLKFEEIKREMNAKEKENENIRRMLETSRSQMKTMRKYITVLTAKDQNRLYHHGDMTQSVGVHSQRGPTSTVSMCTKAPNPCIRPRITEPAPVAGPSWVRQQMHVSKAQNVQEPMRSENHIGDIHIEEIHGTSVHKVDHPSHQLIDSQGLLSETSDPIWGQNPLTSADIEHTDMPDTGMLSTSMMTDDPSHSARMNFGAPSLKIKKEEPEVEIVCVKDEPSEAASSSRFEYPNHELQQQVGEPDLGVPLDLPGSFQALQSPSTSAELTIPAFVGLDPSTYTVMEKTPAEKQREYRARRDADPVRRENYLRKERERWKRDLEAGKRRRIGDLCEKAQRLRRKKWREAKALRRSKTVFRNNFLPKGQF